MWRLDSPSMESSDFNRQVAELLNSLTQDLSAWQQLSQRYQVDLFCGWFMQEGNEGEDISAAGWASSTSF
jgi:hypothetical protein